MGKRSKLYFVTILTALRFPLVFFFFVGAIAHAEYGGTWLFVTAFSFLIASAATDLLDGYFARKLEVETKLGAHADPLLDKFFYLTTLPVLVFVATKNGHVVHGIVLLVLTVLCLLRDQWVTFLRSVGAMYNEKGKANMWGKLRTSISFPLICVVYHYEECNTQLVNPTFLYCFEALAIAVTLISLYTYTVRYYPYLKRAMDTK